MYTMLYSRRIGDIRNSPKKNQRLILDESIQLKYTLYLCMAITGSVLLFFLPTYFFINQNYQIFLRLAFDTHPALLKHLEREIHWLWFFLASGLICIGLLSFFLTIRMTRNLIDPLARMEQHMRKLLQGHWHIPDFDVPKNDFKDLSLTYDYFYRVLKINTEMELKLLEKLNVDAQNREAYAAWKSLIEIKQQKLGLTQNYLKKNIRELKSLNDVKSDEVARLRRVS